MLPEGIDSLKIVRWPDACLQGPGERIEVFDLGVNLLPEAGDLGLGFAAPCLGLGQRLLTGLQISFEFGGVTALAFDFIAQRIRFFLWMPVVFGAGVISYFSIRFEPARAEVWAVAAVPMRVPPLAGSPS